MTIFHDPLPHFSLPLTLPNNVTTAADDTKSHFDKGTLVEKSYNAVTPSKDSASFIVTEDGLPILRDPYSTIDSSYSAPSSTSGYISDDSSFVSHHDGGTQQCYSGSYHDSQCSPAGGYIQCSL